jgi:hypothetical protein
MKNEYLANSVEFCGQPIIRPEMVICGDVDYCLDFSDIMGNESNGKEESIGTSEPDYDVEHHDHEMLKLGLSCCKLETPEFCIMDGFTLYKGSCKEELLPQEDVKHVVSLLRLNYDDILSSCGQMGSGPKLCRRTSPLQSQSQVWYDDSQTSHLCHFQIQVLV